MNTPGSETTQLLQFLSPFDQAIQQLALWLHDFIWDHYSNCNELIYDNYNALAVGWSPTEKQSDIFCSFAVYGNKDLHCGFYWGSQLSDREKILLGNGKQYRYIRVADKSYLSRNLYYQPHGRSLLVFFLCQN